MSHCDLPTPERLAYLRRQIGELRLDPGTYDDAAHEAFMQASPTRRERAERKAAIARLLVSLGAGVSWAERLRLVHGRFGTDGASKPRLKALLAAVKRVDPINYAPALLDSYRGKEASAAITHEAWRFFLTTIRDAAPEFPLQQAWRDARDVAKKEGWDWPSWPTIYRRWAALSEAQRLSARQGRRVAAERLAIPASRDKSDLGALDVVSLDGRTLDLWTDFGDGRAVRPVILILLDVASGFVLDWELAPSENAAATVRLIKRVCETFGIFDCLYTDNGSAFAGHLAGC